MTAAAFAVWLLALASGALAHSGPAPLDEWYRSLYDSAGSSCCDTRDCFPTEAEMRDGQWWVPDPGRVLTSDPPQSAWLPVPTEAVLRRENIDGRPVACIRGGRVVCFVPPAGA